METSTTWWPAARSAAITACIASCSIFARAAAIVKATTFYDDPDVLANGYVTEVEYPKHGKKLKVHGTPWRFSETPAKIGVAPDLGADNDAVLTRIGYSAKEIADFRQRRIV